MTKLILLAAAAAGTFAAGSAIAQPARRVVETRTVVVERHGPRHGEWERHRGWRNHRPHCWTEWHHHRRVRVCR